MINMNNINLNSPEWCELIFNGKNKDYGAYELRADLKDNKEVIEEETEPYVAVEQMPQFPGGNEALLKFISTHLRYPVIAAENGIQGTVTLRFVVSPTGEITKVEVLRQLDPACDKEALRVIKSLPQWVPGKQNGKPVPVYFTVPVRFKLQ